MKQEKIGSLKKIFFALEVPLRGIRFSFYGERIDIGKGKNVKRGTAVPRFLLSSRKGRHAFYGSILP
ncbi:MAG: hypothetical protein B0D92_03685 [Spirochaeta sp. LUC14_002_19_P3]|nr:MAG: hypothetical protein B0D92_03685 [Spirochaeta sp. LUC14_002_19_P3]